MRERLTSPCVIALINGLVGALFLLTPWAARLEEDFGLGWLFQARGPRPPPEQVVLVMMDTESMKRLGLERLHRKWPRRLHAQLIRKLSAAGAAVISFDVFFREPREPDGDRALADAMRQAGNVILFRHLRKEALQLPAAGAERATVFMEQLVDPAPQFAEAATALAPFALPGVPVKVSQFWTFKPEIGETATLPAMAFQFYALDTYEALRKIAGPTPQPLPATAEQMLRSPGLAVYMQQMRSRLMGQPGEATALAEKGDHPLLRPLLSMYRGGDSRFLNYYGPPRTIHSIPYHRALAMSAAQMREQFGGKAVFVGVSEAFQWDQKDTFYTVYSNHQTGHNISGVEIAATAFGNLLQETQVRPLGPGYAFALLLLWGGLAGFLCRRLSAGAAIGALLLLGTGYTLAALGSFGAASVWLPLVVPLFVQLPPVLFLSLLLGYQEAQRERMKIASALGRYLPARVVEDLARSARRAGGSGEMMYGVCLATDAEQYTQLSEQMTPAALRLFLNAYYETIFQAIHDQGGTVSDVVGDAVLALWMSSEPQASQRLQACQAALHLLSAVERFNQQQPEHRLPTRIGLHYGEICIGDVGAGTHYEYRAIGDVVNTATRIEGANKYFGTRLLVSAEGLAGLHGMVTRELGQFRLAGKSRAIRLFELLGHEQECSETTRRLLTEFDRALSAFQCRQWRDASRYFAKIIEKHPEDGPALFYLDLCTEYQQRPPPGRWEGIIELTWK